MNTFVLVVILIGIICLIIKSINKPDEMTNAVETYSPRHIMDTFHELRNIQTKLQLEHLWDTEFAGRDIVWQGRVNSVEASEYIFVDVDCGYKLKPHSDAEYTYFSVCLKFPLSEKTRLLSLSLSSSIKFSAKLPTSFSQLDKHGSYKFYFENAQII